jgi:aminoglycoside 6-adenylyltransferase
MTPKAQQLLDRVAAWASTRDDIRMVMVVGSQARHGEPADDLSDLDLVMASAAPEGYLETTEWLSELGSPVLSFVEATAAGGERERRVLFESGLDVDFTVLAAERLKVLARGSLPRDVAGVFARGVRLVCDKDELGAAILRHIPPAVAGGDPPLTAAAFLERSDDFLYHSLWTARKAARGELFVALRCLDGFLRPFLFELARNRLLQAGALAATRWYGARMIERWAGPDVVAKLAKTCAAHDREGIMAAVRSGMALYAELGREVAAGLGAPFPSAQTRRVGELIEEAARLPSR